jgi:NADH-quinone oxidoreductase subunit H
MVEFLINTVGLTHGLAWTVAAVVSAVLILNVIAGGALVFIWAERKIAGRIQDRLGPTRTGGRFGWLQSVADGIKLLAKEDLMPDGADGLLFRIAPYVSFCASFCAFIALPFAFDVVGQRLNVAVFFVVAVLGLEVFGVILAGYASASKWSLFGAMREAAQVVSYEVPLGMCVVVPVMLAGTMDMVTIAEKQAGWFWNWYLFHDPFTFVIFWVYVTCAVASVNRAPFDLAEAESELVAGFHTEYSGLRWSYFFMAEYGSMFLVSAMAAVLFLGGWNGPIPVAKLAGLSTVSADMSPFLAGLLELLVRLIGLANLLGKATLGVLLMMWIRWTLPRLRIDQVMTTCLKYCTPIAAAMFAGAMLWQLALPGGLVAGLSRPAGEIREGWLEGPGGKAASAPAKPAQAPSKVAEVTR